MKRYSGLVSIINRLSTQTKSQWLRLAVIALLASMLGGCANHATRLDPRQQQANQALIGHNWQASGKLAIRSIPGTELDMESAEVQTPLTRTPISQASISQTPISQTPISQTMRFHWQQQASDYTVTLSDTLGFGRVTIAQQNQQATLTRGKQSAVASNIDQLFIQQTGLALPVSYLRYWALGLPAPAQPYAAAAGSDALVGFEQQGWHVSYPKAAAVDRYLLPEKMIAHNNRYRLVVAFKRWQL
jgi:outer membrane lipoprotein LolB